MLLYIENKAAIYVNQIKLPRKIIIGYKSVTENWINTNYQQIELFMVVIFKATESDYISFDRVYKALWPSETIWQLIVSRAVTAGGN